MKHIFNSMPRSECAEYFFNIFDVVAIKHNRYYSGPLGWVILKGDVTIPVDDKKLLDTCMEEIKKKKSD